ncbi:MAG: carbon-nitrogen hydrolase family protein [Deferribacterales bacterium]
MKQIKVCAVQTDSVFGDVSGNLAKMESFAVKASESGAQLILFPELAVSGYNLTEKIWDFAEKENGETVSKLGAMAKRYGVYLGTTIIELSGCDIFNKFYLFQPDGNIAGTVKKSPPISVEAYLFKNEDNSHIIDTPLGRIGIGICGENLFYDRLKDFYDNGVDIVLQPSAAAYSQAKFPFTKRDIRVFCDMLKRLVPLYSRVLGVPAVMANRCGRLVTELPSGFPLQDTFFAGQTAIADCGGNVIERLDQQEGLIIADVSTGGAENAVALPKRRGKWVDRMPWYAFIWNMTQKSGEKAYARDKKRLERFR